ncbi:hypothetical protein [Gemmatimonas sp.]|uniref:PcfJ domain-containing protein n=1 Tax=Gemmatimonas sp. TaxID=1962908 RepID=UPI003342706C
MKDVLSGLKVRPKRRANGSPRTGETSADLLRSVPTSFPSGAPVKQPGWSDLESYDPQVLSAAAGRGITSALEGTAQMLGGARDYFGGFMQSVRERSPAELRGAAPARSKETYESVNRAVSQAAQDPLTTAKSLASAFVDVGIEAAKSPASMTEFIAGNITPGGRSRPAVSQVVKPKGGDFPKRLEAVENLKSRTLDPDNMFPGMFVKAPHDVALDDWLDTKLSRYIRNEMATPEDPIRKLAEQGILHVNPNMINYDPVRYGDPDLGPKVQALMAESPAAQVWEGATDYLMGSRKAGELAKDDYIEPFLNENPWIAEVAKKDPERKVYLPSEELGRFLGFDHLRDELRNSVRPDSGLPQQLLLTREQLGRMSVPDAVRHVSKINKWREKQKFEANFALANNAATAPFKDYPDQKYGWFQLRADTPEGRGALQEALQYEGDMMGHCVGGYCDDVLSGRSKIYSLRDKKTGAPHVTIEVVPPVDPYGLDFQDPAYRRNVELTPQTRAEYREYIRQWRVRNPNVTGELDSEQMTQALKEAGVPPKYTPVIEQIKGKGNKKPKDEYLPFVQDFVRSGRWDSVEDLDNTGLVDLMRHSTQFPLTSTGRASKQELGITQRQSIRQTAIMQLQEEGLRYVTPQELQSRIDALTPSQQ